MLPNSHHQPEHWTLPRAAVQASVLAAAAFAFYVLWTWWSGAHRGAAHNPGDPWVGPGAAVGLLLGAASIWCRAAHRPALACLLAATLLTHVVASFAGLQLTGMSAPTRIRATCRRGPARGGLNNGTANGLREALPESGLRHCRVRVLRSTQNGIRNVEVHNRKENE